MNLSLFLISKLIKFNSFPISLIRFLENCVIYCILTFSQCERLTPENIKYNNYYVHNKQKLGSNEESLTAFRNNFMHLKDLKNDLN